MTTRMLIRARVLAPLAAVVAVVLASSCEPAYAEPATGEAIFTIPPVWMPLLAGLTTNTLTALGTRINARPWVKALLGAVLVALATVVQDVVANGGLVTDQFGDIFLVTFLSHVALYIGVTRPVKVPEVMAPNAGLS